MDRAEEVRIIESILTILENDEIPMEKEESRWLVSNYYAQNRFEREIEVLFRDHPIIVGHSSQLKAPGDFITHDLSGVPVVVIKGKSGEIFAFLNVCRHRGSQLVPEACGSNKKAFVCPYHAWTYDIDGRLIHIPLPEGFPTVERENYGLVPVPVESRSGFIWVQPKPYSDLGNMEGYLGQVGKDLESYSFEDHIVYKTDLLRKPFNWKIGIEIFLESYHFRVLHRDSTYPIFFDTVGVYDRYYPHMRMITPKRKIQRLANVDRSRWQLRPMVTMAYYIFPNTFMFLEQRLITVMNVFPDGVDHANIAVSYIVEPVQDNERVRKIWDVHIELLWAAAAEDFMIGESLQKNLRSGANTYMTFGRYEKSIHDFHSAIDDALNGVHHVVAAGTASGR